MTTFWDIVKLDLLYSWPQTFMVWLFSFTLLENRPERLLRKLILLTIATSVYTDSLLFFLPFQLHLLNSMLINAVMLGVLFREVPLKQKLGVYACVHLMAILTDLLFAQIAMAISGLADREQILKGPPWLLAAGLYPVLIALWLLAAYLRKRGLKTARRMFAKIVDGWRTGLGKLVVLAALQFVLLGTTRFFHVNQQGSDLIVSVLVCAAILMSLVSLVYVARLLSGAREEARAAQEVFVEDIGRMFTSIRGQRHDFLNHVQVMHTMLQLGKTAALKDYMGDLVHDIRDVSEIVHHPSPPLAAFLKAKIAVAVSLDIRFTFELSDTWNDRSAIRTIDVVKIVGNLVNNAFEEVESLQPAERLVHVEIRCHDDHIELAVRNSGRILAESELQRMFAPGYTTKNGGHSGLGLSIVLERVKHYRGTIEAQSTAAEGTSFRIRLPHRSGSAAESGDIRIG
ncbi:sensor histidine kinase [Cohnella massiliensis]|uniref:sensor histidine kinase n=1 Tax=Cohnella massiliensis TaxID=1816691 RepID=UPI0009B998CC|nr:ATP-binding protein [Cohnella massiliensis]